MNSALNAVTKLAIPAAVGISLLQASLYDVKGGSRAVIFDRLAGVKNEVCMLSIVILVSFLYKFQYPNCPKLLHGKLWSSPA